MNTTEKIVKEPDKMSRGELKGEIHKVRVELAREVVRRDLLRDNIADERFILTLCYSILLLATLFCKLDSMYN